MQPFLVGGDDIPETLVLYDCYLKMLPRFQQVMYGAASLVFELKTRWFIVLVHVGDINF